MAALAKLKLVMEIDGDKVVVERVDQVGDSIERTARKSKTATEQMAGGMGNIETATSKMAATHGQAMHQMSATTRMNHNTMTAFEQQIQSITMRIWNLTMAAGMISAPFFAAGAAILFGINAIDDFQMSATQIAAQLTQLQGPKDVAKHYQESVVYATALAEKLEEVDEKSSINSKGLTAMTQVMTTQGMVLDINNKKQVTAFTDLSNAIAMVTKGQDQQMQAYQEMRSLTTGQVDHNSQLSRMLDSQIKQQGIYKDGLKEVVELGRQHGDLLERLQPYLVGINAASGDISKSWSTATSSLETAINKVVRIGFKDVFADIVPLVSQISSYLKEHATQIGGGIQGIIDLLERATFTLIAYLTLFKGPAVVSAVASWITSFHAGQVATAQLTKQLEVGNVVLLNSAQATAMKTAAQAELASSTAAVALEELNRATTVQAGLVVERESTIAKLQNVIANESLVKSQLTLVEIEATQTAARVTAINANLTLIAKEIAALEAKGSLTKSEAAFSEELRNAEWTSRNKLIIATQEQAVAETNLARVQTSAAEAAQLKSGALTELATVNKAAAAATIQLTEATIANEKAQMASIAATEAAAGAATKARWAWLSLGNVVNVLFAGFIGWEIGGFLNKFEIIRKAGVVMVYGIMGAWHELETAWDRFKATMNPFGDEAEQQAKLAKITSDYNKWMNDFKKNYAEQMKDVEQHTATKPNPTAPLGVKPPATTDTDTIASYNSFVTAFNSKISAVEEANPLLSQHEKELLKIADAQAAMITQYPKQAGEINKLYAWIKQETLAYQGLKDSIKQTSDEFKYLLSVWESETPQHNDAGQFSITNEEIIKLIDTLNGQTAIDEYNEKLRKLNGLMSEYPERAAEISSAISVLNANFKASQLGPTLANISNQLTLVDQAEKAYALNTEQAAQRRIPLLQQEVVEQQKIYDSIKGNEPAAQALRQQTLDKITATNGRLQDQQKILSDRTAIGGMIAATYEYGNAAKDVGAQVKNFVTNIYKGGEDALVSLMATGRVNLKSLIDGMKSDLLHMAAKRIMLSIIPDFSAEVGAATTSAAILANGGAAAGAAMIAGATTAAGILGAAAPAAAAAPVVAPVVAPTSFISAALPYVAVIAAAVVATNYFKSDSWNNKSSSQKGMALGAGLMTGGVANIVDWATGGGLFGTSWKAVRGGVSLGIENGDASGQTYVDSEKKKSWWRGTSRKTEYGALSDQWEQFIDMQFGAVKDTIRNRSTALGITISEEALAGFSSAATKINLSGLSGEDQQKAISDYFRKISNEAITLLVPNIEQMTRLGEDATAAYERMNALKLTNNGLLMAEMELLGSKGTTEYMKLLNVQREAELLKMEDSTKIIQRRIYALQDEAAAAEKAAAALAATGDLTTRLLNATGQDKLASIYALQIKQEKELADAKKNGMDVTNLAYVQTLEMTAAMKALVKATLTDTISLNTSILGTMKALLSSSDSLSPEAAYRQAKSQFATADSSNVSERVNALLEASKNYSPNAAAYKADLQMSLAKLGAFAETAPSLSNVERQIQLLDQIKQAVETGDSAMAAALQITYDAAQIDMGTAKNSLTIALEGIQGVLNTPIYDGTAKVAIDRQISSLQASINTGIIDGTAKTAITGQISALQDTINSPVYAGTAKAAMASQIIALQNTINTTVTDGTTKTALLAQITAFEKATSTYIADGTAKTAIQSEINALQAKLNTEVTGSAKTAVDAAILALQGSLNGTVSAAAAQQAIDTAYSAVQGAINGTISGTAAATAIGSTYSAVQGALNGTITGTTASTAIGSTYAAVQGAINGTLSSVTATTAIGATYAAVQGAINGSITGTAAASAIGTTYATVQGAINGTISAVLAADTIQAQYSSVNSALNTGLNTGTDSVSSMLDKFNSALADSAAETQSGLNKFVNALALVSDYTNQRTAAQTAIGLLSEQYRSGNITGADYAAGALAATAALNATIAEGPKYGLTSLSGVSTSITAADEDARMLGTGGKLDLLSKDMLNWAKGYATPTAAQLALYDVAPYVNGQPQKDGKIDLLDVYVMQSAAAGTIPWRTLGFPAFANGGITNQPSIFGEAGWEAAVPLPDGRSIPVTFSDNYRSTDNSDTISESRALRAEVKELRNELKSALIAIAANTGETAKKLKRWDGDGLPPERQVA